MLGHDILAFLDISCVHNNIILLMTSLVIICLALSVIFDIVGGVALALLMVMTGVAITRSSLGKAAGKENTKTLIHCGIWRISSHPLTMSWS